MQSLLIVLLMSVTNVMAYDLELKKHERAPYDGVLLTEPDYRELVIKERENVDLLKDYMELKHKSEMKDDSWLDYLAPFITGVIVGALIER